MQPFFFLAKKKEFFPYKIPSKAFTLNHSGFFKAIYITANKNVLSKTPGFLNTGDNYVGRMILRCHLHFQDTFSLHTQRRTRKHILTYIAKVCAIRVTRYKELGLIQGLRRSKIQERKIYCIPFLAYMYHLNGIFH